MRAAAGLRAGRRTAAGCRLQRLLSAPRLNVVLSRHPSVAGCSRGIASPIRVVKAARISCYSTYSEAAAASKDESRRQAYRLMARSHARSDEGHTPKPDAIDVLVEQVAAEKLPDVDVFYWAVVTHAKTKPLRPYALRRVLDSMLESGLQPNDLGVVEDDEDEDEDSDEERTPRTGGEVYGMVLHWLMKANRGQSRVLTEALEVISLHGVQPDTTMCNEAIACHAHARPSRPAEAEELIERYMTPKESADGSDRLCLPNAETYELLAQAYTRAPADQRKRHGPSVGERVLGRMVAAGLQPKTANLNAAIAGYALARPPQIDEIDRILCAAERTADPSEPQGDVLLPPLDAASYNWLIHGYANASPAPLPTNAAEVLQRIESSPWPDVHPNVVSYTSVIDAYAKAADYSAAKSVLETMSTAGLEPGIVAIGAVLNAAKKAASATPEGVAIVQEAWELFSKLEKEERNAFVYSSMIGALGQADMKHEAVELFEEAASHLKPWPAAFVFSAAYYATPVPYRNKLGYRWVRETKEAEKVENRKKTFGATRMTNVKPGSQPWDNRRTRKQTYAH